MRGRASASAALPGAYSWVLPPSPSLHFMSVNPAPSISRQRSASVPTSDIDVSQIAPLCLSLSRQHPSPRVASSRAPQTTDLPLIASWPPPARVPSPIVFEPTIYEPNAGRSRQQEKLDVRGFRCNICSATSTPEVRCGPDGKRNLCNKCGIRYAKRRKVDEDIKRRMSVSAILTTDEDPKRRRTK